MLQATDCRFDGGTAQYGANVHVQTTSGPPTGAVARFTRSTFSGGAASAAGAGLHVHLAEVHLTDCSFEGNTSVTHGGGLAAFLGADVRSVRGRYVGNSAQFGASQMAYQSAEFQSRNDRHCGNHGLYSIVEVNGTTTRSIVHQATAVLDDVTGAAPSAWLRTNGEVELTNLLADLPGAAVGLVAPGLVHQGPAGVPTGHLDPSLTAAIALDPAFVDYPALGCDATFTLGSASGAIDAGDVYLLDPDGTVSDLGWTGGAAGLADDDGDGTLDRDDCAPFEPSLPGAEVCDGLGDEDCDGLSDDDDPDCAPAPHTGSPTETDTDTDTDSDSDSDTDTLLDSQPASVASDPGCAGAAGGTWSWAAILAGLVSIAVTRRARR